MNVFDGVVLSSADCCWSFAGIEVQRPKRQVSSEVEVEGLSSSAGTADSPDLYGKSAASDDLSNDAATPDLSPPSSSPPHTPPPPARPSQHRKTARFHRQSAVDHGDKGKYAGQMGEKGGEIQLLVEEGSVEGGGKGEQFKSSNLTEDKKKGLLSKGVVSGRKTNRANGHKHSPSNHKSREHGSSNHRQIKASRWVQSSSSASWTPGQQSLHGRSGQLLEQDEEKISNYEMEMKPLQPRDSSTHKAHGPGDKRHGHGHREGGSNTVQRQRLKNRDGRDVREGKEASRDRTSEKMEPRAVRRDLTLPPPLQSSPMTLEQQDRSLTQTKGNSVSLKLTLKFCLERFSGHIICRRLSHGSEEHG